MVISSNALEQRDAVGPRSRDYRVVCVAIEEHPRSTVTQREAALL
jgi:hypothetical protein